MNILIIGCCTEEFCNFIKQSKHVNKIYTASQSPLENIANIDYSNIEELCKKAKALNIDFAILTDKNHIKYGINEIFKKHRINLISANQKWFYLEASRIIAKQLVTHYSINTPAILKTPLNFPVILKTDEPKYNITVNSMQELISQKENLGNLRTFIEEFCDGEVFEILSLWDGKTLLMFPPQNLTEVQEDSLNLYRTNLNNLLYNENANFVGFFISRLIWAKHNWYLQEFKMELNEKLAMENIKKDFVYLITSAIYQKLYEIN